MAQADLFLIFLKPLNEMGARYRVTGAAAAVAYGQPRMTHDIDSEVYEIDWQPVQDDNISAVVCGPLRRNYRKPRDYRKRASPGVRQGKARTRRANGRFCVCVRHRPKI
jgi:hypothetical protein